MDWISVGPAPADEPCAQVGEDGYLQRAREECHRFIGLLRRKLGKEPPGARLLVKSFPHDFGEYLEVVCCHDGSEAALGYALKCEGEAPARWVDHVVTVELTGLPETMSDAEVKQWVLEQLQAAAGREVQVQVLEVER